MKRTPKVDAAAVAAPEPESTPGTDAMQPDALGEQRAADDTERADRIRRAAYQRYEQRGDAPGDATADWLAAEEEVNRADPHPAVWAP